MSRQRKPLHVVVLLSILISLWISFAAFPHAVRADVPSKPAGWSNVFTDDFNGPQGAAVDGDKWNYDIGTSYPGGPANWGTGEVQSYTNRRANVYLDGKGHLQIKAIRDSSGNWTSGRIETKSDRFKPAAGGIMRVEAKVKLPDRSGSAAQGYWGAFWMLGEPYRGNYQNWPKYGELDILENVNGQNTLYGTLHCGTHPGGPCNETMGLGGNKTGFSPTMQKDYHTYAIEYDRSKSPEQIRWYADGVRYFTLNADRVDRTTWNNAMHNGWFLLLNLAIGGGWPGPPASSTVSGGIMSVDYVYVWTKPPEAPTDSDPIVDGGVYELINPNSGKALDVKGAGTDDFTNVHIWKRNFTVAQKWKVIRTGSGVYKLINPNSGKALDVDGAKTSSGTNVQIVRDNGTVAQRWRFVSNGDGTYTVVNPNSGKALDVNGAGTANGTNVQIWRRNDTKAQKWILIKQ